MTERYDYWDSEWERTGLESTRYRVERLLNQPNHLEAYYPIVRLAKRNNLSGLKALEVGCGSGSYSLILKKTGVIREATLLDVSQPGLDLAKKLFAAFNEDCVTVKGDALNLPFAGKEFDLVLSGGLLEHFKPEEQKKLVAEQCRVARTVLCQVPASTPAYWAMRSLLTARYLGWRWGWEKPMTLAQLSNLFKEGKISVIDSDYHNLFTSGFLLYYPNIFDHIPQFISKPFSFAARHEVSVLCRELV